MLERILVLGGGSEIAAAFVSELAGNDENVENVDKPGGEEHAGGDDRRMVVLAGRAGGTRDDAARDLRAAHPRLEVAVADFDAADTATHAQTLAQLDDTHGPFDTIVVAFGLLGDPFTIDAEPAAVAELAHVNYTGAVVACLAAVNALRGEPNAHLIVFSSIAAVRPRVGNLVYGSAKAGLDSFARELVQPASEVGVTVVIVRPGFVHGRMTEGLEPAPFATTPEAVAKDMVEGIEAGRPIVHSPRALGPVGLALKNLPGFVWRRVSAR